MRYPEGLVVIGPLAFARRNRALFEGSGVVREGRREVCRAQEHIEVVEVAVPGGACRRAAVFVVDDLRERREILTGLLASEEQPNVESERFVVPHGVQATRPAFDNCRAGSSECVHSVRQQCGDLVGDRGLIVVEHGADTKILKPGVTWWRQHPGVGLRRLVLGPGGGAQCRPQVVWGSPEWAHRGHVRHVARRWWKAWRREPAQRDEPGTRLQSVDTAEARRNANGAYEVRSVFEERHPSR